MIIWFLDVKPLIILDILNSNKNLKMKKLNKKLDHVEIDSFFIKKIKEFKTYELSLLKRFKIFSIFDILLLKSVDLSTFIQKMFHLKSDEEEIYIIKRILTKRDQQSFIKWKEYFHSNNIWESFKNLISCQKLLEKFHRQK